MLYAKEVSIAVDLSKMDEVIMKYTQQLAYQMNIKKVNLVHVIPTMLSPESNDVPLRKALGLGFDLNQQIFNHIQDSSVKIFTNGIKTEINVIEGKPYQSLMQQVDDSDTDLLVIGKKLDSDFSGIKSHKVIRHFNGFILFVPEDVSFNIRRISVPIDFSDNSARALNAAIGIASRMENCEVRAVHALNGIPESYYINQTTKDNIKNQLLTNAGQAWKFFLDKNDINQDAVPIDFTGDINATYARILNDYFEANDTDMVIMGAKGHSSFEKFLYGSVTEGLVDTIQNHSILVVR